MKRRDFIKTTLAAGILVGHRFSWAGSRKQAALLLEAAQFQEKGGWVLDQQFMDQMGSSFLLAHGLGKPVADAVAKVKFPETGTYKLWVRTRDWVGPWKTADTPASKRAFGSPGVFKVLINGKPVETTFGERNADWHWQDGGAVEIAEEEVEISLHDLTGFEGRCAGIFLTKDAAFTLPQEGESLLRFRRAWHGYSEQPEDAGDYDLVVVGGGMAGTCAAVSAARHGIKVAFIQDRPVVGGNNSSEVRVWLLGAKRGPRARNLGHVLQEFEQEHRAHYGPDNAAELYEDEKKMGIVRAEKNIAFFPSHRMNGVEMKEGSIVAVVAENIETGKRLRFTGATFADCTGDGCVGHLAGADYDMTIEEGHMGRCNLWHIKDAGEPKTFPRCPWALDLTEKLFPGRRGVGGGSSGQHASIESLGCWYWESGFYHDPFEKSEYIRDWNFRAMYGAWDCLKNVDKVYPNFNLNWAAYISGKRESRRLLGDLILNKEDVTKPIEYEDGLAATGWKIDLHLPDPRYNKGFEGDAFISKAYFSNSTNPYYVPYRCFYSRNVGNLFMAGRCISVTHEALGTVRVMRTCALMGEVVGMAASLCKKHQADPRGVYKNHLSELKKLCGFVDTDAPAEMEVLEAGKGRRVAGIDDLYNIDTP
ncbi:MAG TPA: FAD-dependent oxidoreductase [Phycisphaerae bacterium]|nr:FAD-dependent oxidoreductase [Phycisphaerae bacterium]